jgi:hypothetical protein
VGAKVVGDNRVQGILANRAMKREEQVRLSWSWWVLGVLRMALFCRRYAYRWMQVIRFILTFKDGAQTASFKSPVHTVL